MIIKILLADKNPLRRQGLILKLEGVPGLVVSGDAENVIQMEDSIRSLTAHLVIADVNLPGIEQALGWKDVARRIKPAGLILISPPQENDDVIQLLSSDIAGMVLESTLFSEIQTAIHIAGARRQFISPFFLTPTVQTFLDQRTPESHPSVPSSTLQRK